MSSLILKGNTSGQVTIQAPDEAGTTTLTLPTTNSTLATQNALGVRNLIINGDMRIDQRNGGASGTSANTYTLDRWRVYGSQTGKWSWQQSTNAPSNFTNSIIFTSSSAYTPLSTDVFLLQQPIEGLNTAHLGFGTSSAKTITLSFWTRSSLTGTFAGSFRNSASNRSYVFTYTINSANTWEYKTITIDGDTTGTWLTTNGVGLVLRFSIGAGSNYDTTAGSWQSADYYTTSSAVDLVATNGATWQITGVQLEIGSATPFEHRPYDMELARCQRYYFQYAGNTAYRFSTGYVLSATQSWHHVYAPTTMRTNPDLSYANFEVRDPSNAGIPSSIIIGQNNPNEIYLVTAITGGTAGNGCQFRAYADNAYMKFSAEL